MSFRTNINPVLNKMKGFYWYFRPIALGFKIFGIFPLDNVLDLNTSNLKFRLASSSHMYSTLILISFSAMIYYFCGFIFSLSSYAEVVISYVIYGMIGRTVGCFLVYGFKKYHELPTLIQLLDSFDKQKKEIVIPQCYSKKTLVSRTIAPSVMIILFLIITLKLSAGVIFSALPNELRNQKNAMLYCYVFAYLMNRGLLPSLLYIYFAHTINYGFKEINNTLYQKQIIPSYYNDIKYPSDMHMILTKVRFLHNVLAECVTKLSTVFGSFMAIDQFGVVVVFVINVSVYIYLRTQFINLLTVTMANAFLVGWVLFISHEIQKNVSILFYNHPSSY